MTTDSADRGLVNTNHARGATAWTWGALVVALVGVAGSIGLTLGLDLIPCPLCYYQRTFIMAAFGVLALGMLAGARHAALASLLALPMALGGLGVAGVHALREYRLEMECPPGWLGIGTAPQQSVALFLLLTIVLLADVLQGVKPRLVSLPALAGSVVLGVLLSYGSLISAKPPDIPKDGPLVGCRKPALK
jgi:hypothetical protein